MISSGSSAVLLVRTAGRLFAITFGYGRGLLNREACEDKFGLLVTLNSIDSSRIRTLESRSLDAVPRLMSEQASYGGTIDSFGINVEHDLVRSLGGAPADSSLGKRLGGTAALSVKVSTTLDEIPKLLTMYYEKRQGFFKFCVRFHLPQR